MNSTLEIFVYLVAALVPAFILMVYIYRQDRVEKESLRLLVRLVFLGVVSAGSAIILEDLFAGLVIDTISFSSLLAYAFIDALMVALVEESCKFYFLIRETFYLPDFNYRYDGIVYAVFVGLGFAAIENVLYVFQYGLSVALLRGLLAVPAHMAFAVYMGSFYGNGKYALTHGKRKSFRIQMILAFIVPVVLHAFYDMALMAESDFFFWLFIVFVAIMYIVVFVKIRKASKKDQALFK